MVCGSGDLDELEGLHGFGLEFIPNFGKLPFLGCPHSF